MFVFDMSNDVDCLVFMIFNVTFYRRSGTEGILRPKFPGILLHLRERMEQNFTRQFIDRL